jgi:hypothetical protein
VSSCVKFILSAAGGESRKPEAPDEGPIRQDMRQANVVCWRPTIRCRPTSLTGRGLSSNVMPQGGFVASLTQQQIEAAQEFSNAAIDALKTERGVHAETVVAGAARMAGTFLFRSFGFPNQGLEPGQVVLSDKANEEGPVLIQVLGGVLSHIGVTLEKDKLGDAASEQYQPNLGFLETQKLLEPRYLATQARLGLTQREAAEAAAVASAFLIQQCSAVLDPHAAFGVAVYGFIEGAKTAPDPVAL